MGVTSEDPPGLGPGTSEQPTQTLVASAGDRCASCSAPLASDQRYCLNCGERRGKARFPAAATAPPVAPASATRERPRPRLGSGGALIAGVGTLLLAVGVGVLIGRTSNPQPVASRNSPEVISVGGSGGSAGTSGSSGSSGSSSSKNSSKHGSSSKAAKVVITKKVAAKAAAAASKVLGGNGVSNPTVTVGQAGHGAGYSGGHFTGTFFH